MIIKRYRDKGRILNCAKHKKDQFLFEHCANGSMAVTTRYFNENVAKVLFAHGIMVIEIDDQTRK